MASRSLGVLTIDLIARIGGFTQGMDKAARDADKAAKEIEKRLLVIGTAANAVGTAIGEYIRKGIDLALNAFPELIDQVSKFQDIAEKTGASAQGLADLAVAAGVAGTDMETIATASVKLTKNLTDGSKATSAALKALGIDIKDFKQLAPEQQMVALSDALDKFRDGSGKTAVAVDTLGKSGADLLPFLKALKEIGTVRILTDEQIQAADNYADQLARNKTELQLMAGAAATQVIPVMSALTSLLTDVAKEILNVSKEASGLGVNNGVRVFAQSAGEFIAQMLDYFKTSKAEFGALTDFFVANGQAAAAALKGNFAEVSRIAEDYRQKNGLDRLGRKIAGDAGAAAGRTYVQQFRDQIASGARTAFASLDPRRVDLGASGKPKDTRSPLNYSGAGSGGGSKDDPTKKLLDNQLKELDRYINAEKDLMAERNKFLDLYNGQGLLSIKDYFDKQAAIRDEATQNQIAAYDKQIDALRKYQASATKATDRADAEGKINDLLDKQAKLQRDAGNAALEAGFKMTEAQKKYADTIAETNARLLELQGEIGKAAAIRFDIQNEGLLKLFSAEGNQEMLEKVARIKELTVAQANLNQLSSDYSLIQGQLQVQEDRIALAQQLGTQGEIDGLVKLGEIRRESYEQLKKIVDEYRALAILSDNKQMILQSEQLRLQLERLGAELDPLAQKFNEMFADKFGEAFSSIIDGTKSVKEALRDMVNSFIAELAKLAAKDVFKSLLSGGGSATGGFGFDLGSLLSGLFGGGRANGGPVAPNTLYRVNERGPELFSAANGDQFLMTGASGGRVIPNGSARGSGVTNINVTVSGMVDNRTRSQIAQDISVQQRNARRFA